MLAVVPSAVCIETDIWIIPAIDASDGVYNEPISWVSARLIITKRAPFKTTININRVRACVTADFAYPSTLAKR